MVADSLYTHYLHGIEERTADVFSGNCSSGGDSREDIKKTIFNHQVIPCQKDAMVNQLERQVRISITIRHVPKTVNLNLAHLLGKSLHKNSREN